MQRQLKTLLHHLGKHLSQAQAYSHGKRHKHQMSDKHVVLHQHYLPDVLHPFQRSHTIHTQHIERSDAQRQEQPNQEYAPCLKPFFIYNCLKHNPINTFLLNQ